MSSQADIALAWSQSKGMESPSSETQGGYHSLPLACGTVQDLHWLQLEWPPSLQLISIAVKKLIPVVLAMATFRRSWPGIYNQFVVDNEAVVSILNSIYCSDVHMIHLVRLLMFFAAKFDFWFSAIHIQTPRQMLSLEITLINFSMKHYCAQSSGFHDLGV